MTYNETLARVVEEERVFQEFPTSASTVEVTADALRVGDQRFDLGQELRSELFGAIGAPVKYLEGLRESSQVRRLQEVFERGDFGQRLRVVTRDQRLFTVLNDRLISLTGLEVLTAVADALQGSIEGLMVSRIVLDGGLLDVDLVSREKSIDVRVGDVVQGGLHIRNDRFGGEAVWVETYAYRLVCRNGMVRRECASRRGPRTRKLPITHPGGRELQIEQIRRLVSATWDDLQPKLEAFRKTAERPVENVEEVLRGWLQRARISGQVMIPRLRAAWREEGSENTHYGAVNALTRVATHDARLSARQRRVMASLAGVMAFEHVHICPRCFSVFTGFSRTEETAA